MHLYIFRYVWWFKYCFENPIDRRNSLKWYPQLSIYSHFISKKSRHHITTVCIIIISLCVWSQQTLACMIYCNRKCMKHYKEQQPSFFQTGGWLSFEHTFISWTKFRHITMLYYRLLILHIFSCYGIYIIVYICVTRKRLNI